MKSTANAILTADHVSCFRQVYGRAGDRVTVIREEGELALVELNGQRFYTNKEKLRYDNKIVNRK